MEDLRRVLIAKHNEPPFCAGSEGCLGAKIACDILADCSRQPGDAAFYWWLIMYLYHLDYVILDVRKVWRRYTQRTHPAKREIKHVVFDPCRENVRMACVL